MAFKIFTISNVATVITCMYLYGSIKGIYNLMAPLNSIDISAYQAKDMVKPYWSTKKNVMGMKVYLSTNKDFTADYLIDEYTHKKGLVANENDSEAMEPIPQKKNKRHDSILLWEEPFIKSSSLSKSFIITTDKTESSESLRFAANWLDEAEKKDAERKQGGSISSLISGAGDGIESTSLLLALYTRVGKAIGNLFGTSSEDSTKKMNDIVGIQSRDVITVPEDSSIWKNMMQNSTVYVQVVLQRNGQQDETFQEAIKNIAAAQQSHELLVDGVDLIKFDEPHHIVKPKRYLYKDIVYIIRRYILRVVDKDEVEPWNMSVTAPEDFRTYEMALKMKESKAGYPYWKPEVACKLVSEEAEYPLDYVGYSQMDVIQVDRKMRKEFESGYAYLPGLYVDEMGLTSDKYIPLNKTVTALPLKFSFDSSGANGDDDTSGGLSPGRWRLLKHLTKSLDGNKELGFEQSDIDDVKRLVADTNVMLLGVTVMASTLHMLFEFLTFKSDVEFWRSNKDLTGLSVRALFMDFFSQSIILLFLIEKDSSLLMTIPSAIGCLIALWKFQRGSGLKFVRISNFNERSEKIWNKFFGIFGVHLKATRLQTSLKSGVKESKQKDLAVLTEEMDQLATKFLGIYFILPLVTCYTAYTLLKEQHSGWYSWAITSASSAVYGIGFVLMTPQLFLNYKLKSVAHLPWRVLGFRFVNTFIDDLFAFIIRMPTMARISCFRDDIVFIIYLGQRFMYPVDTSRPTEGGGMDAVSAAAAVENAKDSNETKKKQ